MSERYLAEKEVIKNKFESLVSMFVRDPDFEFEVIDVKTHERKSITGSASARLFSVEVETNNRPQLMGQRDPYTPDCRGGHLEETYRARLIEEIQREFQPDYGFSVEICATQLDPADRSLDRQLPLQEAIDEGLVPTDSPLARTMREYDLEQVVLAGGSAIVGPSVGAFETMEQVFENREIETVLDLFAGSGGYSRAAVAYGAKHVDAIDVDVHPLKANLGHRPETNIHQMDVFDFSPRREYDLIISDPNYDLAKRFIREKLPELVERCDYYFQNTASVGHTSWKETIISELAPYFETQTEYNTGRVHQVLCRV